MHHDEALHLPPVQSPEQQSPLVAQVLFSVLQVVLSGTQVPPVPPSALQMPLQQVAFEPQAVPSPRHGGRLQTPPEQTPVQQSASLVQPPPTVRQVTPPSDPKPELVTEVVPELVPELVPPVPPEPPVLLPPVPLEGPQPAARAPPAEIARAKIMIVRRRGRMASFPGERESPNERPLTSPSHRRRASEIRAERDSGNLVTTRTSSFFVVARVTTPAHGYRRAAHIPYHDIQGWSRNGFATPSLRCSVQMQLPIPSQCRLPLPPHCFPADA
jgi:hypothetical protein